MATLLRVIFLPRPDATSRFAGPASRFVGWFAFIVLFGATICHAVERIEPTGCIAAGMEPFDAVMTALLQRWDVPGAGLAVANDGRLLLARGYGFANTAAEERVTPRTRFRLGSLSKPVASVAILQLVSAGRLTLDDKAIPLLGEQVIKPDEVSDPRAKDITIRQLLEHTAGFDRDKSGDPAFMPRAAVALERQSAAPPPTCPMLIRDTLRAHLDFDPGSRFAYSNLGYCMLGRIVERASGMPYLDYVRSHILGPADASHIDLGSTMRHAENEATYYDYPNASLVSAMPGVAQGMVAAPYGAFPVEAMDSYGGLIGSPVDYLRFMMAIDGQRGQALLDRNATAEMLARPNISSAERPIYYGLGMSVRVLPDGGKNWWHTGTQPGMEAFALRTAVGYSWVAAFNSRPRDVSAFWQDIDRSLWSAAQRVAIWPKADLFGRCGE
jgi:CubicO group peptidase (beta-lactamase class C family)